MKKLFVLAIIFCTLFSSLTMVSASELYTEPVKNIESVTVPRSSVIVNYSTLKVGHSIFLMGDSLSVVSGSSYVTTNYMRVTGKSPGQAVIYAYKNGVLYSKQYITVIR